MPHNRGSSRRIQNMGFIGNDVKVWPAPPSPRGPAPLSPSLSLRRSTPHASPSVQNGMWMTLNGGALLTTPPNPDLNQVDIETLFEPSKVRRGPSATHLLPFPFHFPPPFPGTHHFFKIPLLHQKTHRSTRGATASSTWRGRTRPTSGRLGAAGSFSSRRTGGRCAQKN